jgi:hypothetical protein
LLCERAGGKDDLQDPRSTQEHDVLKMYRRRMSYVC